MNEQTSNDGRRERTAAYLAGELSNEERRRFEDKTLSSDDLASELYSEINLVESFREIAGDGKRSRSVGRPTIPRPVRSKRRLVHIAVPVAAAILVAVLLPRLTGDGERGEAPVFRGHRNPGQPIAPAGIIENPPDSFVWFADPNAHSYQFELFDSKMGLLHEETTVDTMLVLGEGSPKVAELRQGVWRVSSLDENGDLLTRGEATPFRYSPAEP